MKMYYEQNKLIVTVHNYDATVAIAASAMLLKYHAYAKKNFRIELCDNCATVHVCTLVKWLKAYHADPKVPSLRQDRSAEEGDDQTLARRTFGVVQSMRAKPWKDVEEVLAAFFRAIISYQDTMEEMYVGESDDEEDFSEEKDGEESEDENEDDEDDLPPLEPMPTSKAIEPDQKSEEAMKGA